MHGEVRKIYSSHPHVGGTQHTVVESCIVNSLWFQQDVSVPSVCKGQMAVYSEVSMYRPMCKVLKRGSHLYNKKISLMTCRNT